MKIGKEYIEASLTKKRKSVDKNNIKINYESIEQITRVMENKIVKGIKIDGVVDLTNNVITIEEFTNRFIEWIENNNWQFGGITGKYKDEYGDFE